MRNFLVLFWPRLFVLIVFFSRKMLIVFEIYINYKIYKHNNVFKYQYKLIIFIHILINFNIT